MNISAHPALKADNDALSTAPDTAHYIAFTQLLPALTFFIEAERDLHDISTSYDPAYAAWHRDAQLARAGLDAALRHFHGLRLQRAEDQPLRHMALFVDALLNDDDPARPRHLHRQMQLVFFQRFQVRGFGARAQQCNAMLIQARHLVDAMIRLPLFDFSADCADAAAAEAQTLDLVSAL